MCSAIANCTRSPPRGVIEQSVTFTLPLQGKCCISVGMDRLGGGVLWRRQQAINQMRPRDRLRLCATLAFQLAPKALEVEQRTLLIRSKLTAATRPPDTVR